MNFNELYTELLVKYAETCILFETNKEKCRIDQSLLEAKRKRLQEEYEKNKVLRELCS